MRPAQSGLERLFANLGYLFHAGFCRKLSPPGSLAREVERHSARYRGASEALLGALRYRLRRDGFTDPLIAECFALYCAGQPAAVPLESLGAARRLIAGASVELADRAARRHAIALAALARAIRGERVHLLAASDAAAKSLAESISPIFTALGIRVGCLARELTAAARREVYSAPVLCAAHRELALDYLRESMQSGARGLLRAALARLSSDSAPPMVGELQCALVEDAELVMLDDAQAPIVIAAPSDQSRERLMYEQALELARTLAPQADFTVEGDAIRLTQPAAWRLEQLVAPLSGIWSARGRREELVTWALEALHFLQRDSDYRVEQGRVLFPPPAAGAEEPGPDELELRKLVEVKEGCPLSSRPEVLARLSVPRFLSRYAALAGMCADASGVEKDFWALYSLRTVRAGPPFETIAPACRVFVTAQAKRAAVIERARSRPAVVALRSRSEAQALQATFAEAGLQIAIAVLPVLQPLPRQEDNVELLVAELPLARRHIAQACRAYGACSCSLLLSLEDEALAAAIGPGLRWLARLAARSSAELPPLWARWVASRAQRAIERAQRMARQDLKARERLLEDLLAVSGQGE